jgi:hypothetical protein
MRLRSLLVIAIAAAVFAAPAVVADDLNIANRGAAAVTTPHHSAKKPKSPATGATDEGTDQIQFSQPDASPLAPTKKINAAAQPGSRAAPSEPNGGVSLDFKWRASNEKVDPFDAVRHTSGPNGPGDAVQGGVKIGF